MNSLLSLVSFHHLDLFLFAYRKKLKSFLEKLTNWELWPFKLRYLPITPAWFWYCFRAGSPWFFVASNPTITFGGFEGEGKKEMYEQLPESLCPKTIYVSPGDPIVEVISRVKESGFVYPFCVKPDVGMKGLLFRKIDREDELRTYHEQITVDYIVQELVEAPLEVSVFYYRYPWEEQGVITGFIQKELMEVRGDGKKPILQLIEEHPKAKHRLDEMKVKHAAHLHLIPSEGEPYILTYAANLNRGARFTNLAHLIDESLLVIFDEISHKTSFYYGRYDIKCGSIKDLKQGHFMILEFNGSGAEPNHVYHSNYSWFGALSVFLMHWKVLYKISVYNHKKGVPYWPLKKGLNFLKEARKHFDQMEEDDRKILV